MNKKLGYIIDLPKIEDPRGNLTVVEETLSLPFRIQRMDWTYGFSTMVQVANSADEQAYHLIVPLSGSFVVELLDGIHRERRLLNHPYQGLLVLPGISTETKDFSNGAVYMVITLMKV